MTEFLKPQVKETLLRSRVSNAEIINQIQLVQDVRSGQDRLSQDIDIYAHGVEDRQRSLMVGLGNLANKIDKLERLGKVTLSVVLAIGLGVAVLLFK